MNTSKLNSIRAAAIVLLTSITTLGAEDTTHGTMTAEDHAIITMSAKVLDIDRNKRELTLKTSAGEVNTVTVDQAVKRFDEIKKDDQVNVKYLLSMVAELREPTPEEKENPILISAGETKVPTTAPPSVKSLRLTRAVATVEGLQRPTRLVTLKGPRGKYMTVRATDPKRMEKLHLGDTIVVTFTEALAVSVEKAE